MNPQKITISVVLIVAVVGGIIYLNSQKADRGSGNGTITVTPRLSLDRAAEKVSNSKEEIPSEKKATPNVSSVVKKPLPSEEKSNRYELAKEITTPDGFINTDGKPVTINQYIGKKVILVDFWTYSCINCQRTTPYLNAWYEKYKDKGFVIIGIHTPEFEFEKVYQNVLEATKRLEIKYPVVLDNDYSTWSAYQNRFWPRKYLIDIDGYIVYDHIGEGQYEETEQKIQDALKERMAVLGENGTINQPLTQETPLQGGTKSPETYFGANRNEFLGNGIPGKTGEQSFAEPITVEPNKLYLIGSWNVSGEYAETSAAVGSPQIGSDRIDYRYRAKGVYLVAGSPNKPIEVEVLLDSGPIGTSIKGADIFYKNGKSYVRIQENRLYRIIDDKSSAEHFLEFIISDPGLQAYTFTFG